MAGYFGISFFKKDPPRVSETGQTRNTTSLLQASEPSINLFAGLVFSIAVALLQTTLQLVALAVDRGEIIVSEFAHFSFTLPFTSFQFPSTRFQSMA